MDKSVIINQFNSVASIYESYRLADWYKSHGKLLLEIMEPCQPGSTIVDIGCGTGWLLRQIASTNPEVQLIGVDIAPKMIAIARDRAFQAGLRNIQFIAGDWETISQGYLGVERVQTIFCSSCLHYFDDPERALNRMFFTLDQGGNLTILERDTTSSTLTKMWHLAHQWVIKDHVTFYAGTDIVNMLKNLGFSSVVIKKRVRKYFWNKKFFTSIIILKASKNIKSNLNINGMT